MLSVIGIAIAMGVKSHKEQKVETITGADMSADNESNNSSTSPWFYSKCKYMKHILLTMYCTNIY